jgi:phage/plasmid-like protein (TIGR03299 family)
MKMSHEIETAYYADEPAWHRLGTVIQGAQNSKEAMRIAGLEWTASVGDLYTVMGSEPLSASLGLQMPGFLQGVEVPAFRPLLTHKAVIRDTDKAILGVMTKQYRPVQNVEAFAFTDALLNMGGTREVLYESAGSLKKGRVTWLLARMDPGITIAGDQIIPYLLFQNSFDGSMGVRVCITAERVVCWNTLTLALQQAPRCWSIQHRTNVLEHLHDAAKTLELSEAYITQLPDTAEKMIATTLYPNEVKKLLEEIIEPVHPESLISNENAEVRRAAVRKIHDESANIKPFRDTAWGWYQAVTDYVAHVRPINLTKYYRENLFYKIMNGHPVIQKTERLLAQIGK